jgi:hypothetical protein
MILGLKPLLSGGKNGTTPLYTIKMDAQIFNIVRYESVFSQVRTSNFNNTFSACHAPNQRAPS